MKITKKDLRKFYVILIFFSQQEENKLPKAFF